MQIAYTDTNLIKKYNVKEPLIRHVTRRISYKMPAGADEFDWPDKIQTVTFHRFAIVETNIDESIDYNYSMWKAEGRAIWPEVVSPKSEGYKANPVTVPRIILDEKSHDEDVEVTYTPVSVEAKEAYNAAQKDQKVSGNQSNNNDEVIEAEQKIKDAQNNLFGNLTNLQFQKSTEDNNQPSTPDHRATDRTLTNPQYNKGSEQDMLESSLKNKKDNPIGSEKEDGKDQTNTQLNSLKEITELANNEDNDKLDSPAEKKEVFGPSKEHLLLIPYKGNKEAEKVSERAKESSSDSDKSLSKITKVESSTDNKAIVDEKDDTNSEKKRESRIRRDYEQNFARLADMHSRPTVLSNEYAHLREDATVASVIGTLAQTGEIDYAPIRHNWDRVDYDWGGLFE
ncbi:hypothetical protein LMB49_03670 [Limosilactobacillus reuteri]|uniref:mucin-binding protein n=1 Tax=Limosilactobacillus reuteri TaxID=1598 RepID=UPI001E2ADE8D|nr:hypothetical protein [Limosilactobacillus reuteri]MCC4370495.1 hypothetical protein [Limosilactobacillus reuteri]MCC4508243.1 hypothetical protein [Limosilactobacillus reuteri]